MSFKLFKKARSNSKNSSGYLKYAIGEIILVALGILIALQVNNMNQSRLEKKALKNYFEKIKSNVQLDMIESEKLLKFRTDHAHACNEVSQMLIDNDFSNQLKIQQSIFDMIIEKQLNYNRSAFESLKSSGFLRHLHKKSLEKLLYSYYDQVNEIEMFEIDQRDWANALELELDKNGFIYEWTQIGEKVHKNLFTQISWYSKSLKSHEGHKIIMRLLFRGGSNTSLLTGLYENHIQSSKKLLEELDLYLKEL